MCAAPSQQVGTTNVCPPSSICRPRASNALQKWFMSITSPGSGSDLQIFFNAAPSSAPSSRQANSSAEHPPFWCRQGPCSCLQARWAGSCLEMPTELCIHLLTQAPPGQILQLPDLQHPSLFSFCRGKSESPMPRLEPKLFWSLQSQRVPLSGTCLFFIAFYSLQETIWGDCARNTDNVIIIFIITEYAQKLVIFKSGQLCTLQSLNLEVHTWKEREFHPCSSSVLVSRRRAALMSSNHTREPKIGRGGISLCTE